jgi:hypothetical protein
MQVNKTEKPPTRIDSIKKRVFIFLLVFFVVVFGAPFMGFALGVAWRWFYFGWRLAF